MIDGDGTGDGCFHYLTGCGTGNGGGYGTGHGGNYVDGDGTGTGAFNGYRGVGDGSGASDRLNRGCGVGNPPTLAMYDSDNNIPAMVRVSNLISI